MPGAKLDGMVVGSVLWAEWLRPHGSPRFPILSPLNVYLVGCGAKVSQAHGQESCPCTGSKTVCFEPICVARQRL